MRGTAQQKWGCWCSNNIKTMQRNALHQHTYVQQCKWEFFFFLKQKKKKSWQVWTLRNPLHSSSPLFQHQMTSGDRIHNISVSTQGVKLLIMVSHLCKNSSSINGPTFFSACNCWIFFLHLALCKSKWSFRNPTVRALLQKYSTNIYIIFIKSNRIQKYWLTIVISWRSLKAAFFLCTLPQIHYIPLRQAEYLKFKSHKMSINNLLLNACPPGRSFFRHHSDVSPGSSMRYALSVTETQNPDNPDSISHFLWTIRKPETYNTHKSVNNRADYALDRVCLSAHLSKCWWQVNSLCFGEVDV